MYLLLHVGLMLTGHRCKHAERFYIWVCKRPAKYEWKFTYYITRSGELRKPGKKSGWGTRYAFNEILYEWILYYRYLFRLLVLNDYIVVFLYVITKHIINIILHTIFHVTPFFSSKPISAVGLSVLLLKFVSRADTMCNMKKCMNHSLCINMYIERQQNGLL